MKRYAMVQFDWENLLIHTSLQRGDGSSHKPLQTVSTVYREAVKTALQIKDDFAQSPR